ncbi:MAG: TolC family protein [Vicinamibacterales bacterium]|nr:TolC family protein [Vicinamibacterales bacterium]
MSYRTFVASTSFVLFASAALFAQAPSEQKLRTEDLVKQAVERYNDNLRASALTRAAQDPSPSIAVVGAVNTPMTLDEAVRHALDNNLELAVERLNPQTFDLTLASLRANYKPVATSTFGRRDNTRPPSNLLNPGSPSVSTMTYNAGLSQNMQWYGGVAALAFSNSKVVSPTDKIASFDPQYNSSYLFSYTQPLMRGFKIDQTRQQMQTTIINRDNADLNLRARSTNTLANVRSAYWDYAYTIQAVDVARESLTLAQKLLSDNKVRVEVGTMAPMDVVQAEAEEATRQQTLTVSLALMRTAELALKRLIVGGTNDPLWTQHIDPVDRPDFQSVSIDVEGAVRTALQQRTDLQIARNNFNSNSVVLKSQRDQSLPDIDAVVSYGASGLGGTQYAFNSTGLDRVRTGVLVDGGYSNALGTLFGRDYPNWNLAVNISYPIGGNTAEAQAARTRLLLQQNQAQIRASELTVATEVTNAALQVTNSTESLAAARAARDLSQRRLDAEMSRFEVGMSTNYQVVQMQRDLRDAQNSELRALLNYRKSLVEYDRVQQAGAR